MYVGRGQAKVVELLKQFFFDLNSSGKGIFAIAHTQLRTVRDKGSENTEGYQILTSNLTTKYEAIFGDIFDYVFTGTIDRAIKDGVATSDERIIYFRGNTRIDAGGRFADGAVKEYIIFEGDDKAKRFIEEIEKGMKNSLYRFRGDDEEKENEYKEYKEALLKEHEEMAEINKNKIKSSDKYKDFAIENGLDFIKKNFDNKSFSTKVKEIVANSKVSKISELSSDEMIEIVRYGHEELGLDINHIS